MSRKLIIIYLSVIGCFVSAELLGSVRYYGGPKHSYDVQNYKLELDLYNCFKSPYPRTFKAINTITLRVDSSLSILKFDASSRSLAVDSVKILNGSINGFSHASNVLNVTLSRIYNPGEMLNVVVYYRHNNVVDTSYGWLSGIRISNGLVYTDCEPEGARCWFPCWDRPSDKATVDITAKVPSGVLLASNGLLYDSSGTADSVYYRWVSTDPMATYLVAISGSVYYRQQTGYWHRLSNPSDSIPVKVYYNGWSNPGGMMDTAKIIADYFSTLFSDYRFQKIGYAGVDSSQDGGMENQTLITFSPNVWNYAEDCVAHEFGHHWFGDLITCGTWADIWLNESFAQYCNALSDEHYRGMAAYRSFMSIDSMLYMSYGYYSEPIYNPAFINSTPNTNNLFLYPVRYSKGCCVLYMLRGMLGDSLFFGVLKSYTSDTNFVFKTAVTDDFTAKLNQFTGQDYTWFINEWVKQPGHPKYANTYGISNLGNGNWRINFRTSQNLSFSPFHKMPIELKIKFHNNSDTLMKVMNDANNQLFTFDFNKQPDLIQFDPDNKIILKQVTTSIGINNSSGLIPERYYLYQNYPNPFNASTCIRFDIKEKCRCRLVLYDMLGREAKNLIDENYSPGYYTATVNLPELASGIYFCRMTAGEYSDIKRLVIIK